MELVTKRYTGDVHNVAALLCRRSLSCLRISTKSFPGLFLARQHLLYVYVVLLQNQYPLAFDYLREAGFALNKCERVHNAGVVRYI